MLGVKMEILSLKKPHSEILVCEIIFSRPPQTRRQVSAYVYIVIVISKLLKRHSKTKRRAPAYSRALRQIRWCFPKNRPWEAQVRLPEGERMRQIRGVFPKNSPWEAQVWLPEGERMQIRR